jgi:hypothetical protein
LYQLRRNTILSYTSTTSFSADRDPLSAFDWNVARASAMAGSNSNHAAFHPADSSPADSSPADSSPADLNLVDSNAAAWDVAAVVSNAVAPASNVAAASQDLDAVREFGRFSQRDDRARLGFSYRLAFRCRE